MKIYATTSQIEARKKTRTVEYWAAISRAIVAEDDKGKWFENTHEGWIEAVKIRGASVDRIESLPCSGCGKPAPQPTTADPTGQRQIEQMQQELGGE